MKNHLPTFFCQRSLRTTPKGHQKGYKFRQNKLLDKVCHLLTNLSIRLYYFFFSPHRCCEQLLVGRKKQPISDQAEDLECLCHLIRTCGKNLDTTVGKVRMDQYFDRLSKVVANENMPVRIRFMIQDLIDMRRNKWQARRIGKSNF